jgi:threonine synthase
MVESWHNTQWEFEGFVRDITALVRNDKQRAEEPGAWMQTAVRIAVLFGVFGELIRAGIASEENKVDVALVAGDFSAPLSAWIARQMGLPIGNIVLCCNENSGVWNLVYHGEFRTDAVSIQTTTPQADIPVPAGLEAFISLSCGQGETERYLETFRRGKMYSPEGNILAKLREGIEVSVISQSRLEQTIPSVFGTNSYLLSPYAGLAYAGLLDYRARTGESGYGLVLADRSPAKDEDYVCGALGISSSEFQELLKRV